MARLLIEFGGPLEALPWEQRHDALEGATMVVNTTNQGMVGQSALDIKLDKLPQTALAADIVYIPLETPFRGAQAREPDRQRSWHVTASRPAGVGRVVRNRA